jgi:ABC-type bacteriocin/lantibiotic exporter with double-glycine peptidase domain
VSDLLDLLLLLVLLFCLIFNLGLFVVLLVFIFLVSIIVGVSDFFFGGLLDLELDWEADEFGVLLDEIFESAFF